MNIGKFSVTNSVFVNILMAAILFLGIFSFIRLPREVMSEVNFSWVLIAVPYPGVSAEEVEKNITSKIEQEVSDVDHIKKITSTTRDGYCTIFAQFEDIISDDEFRRAYQDLRAEFDKVELPEGTLEPYIDDFSSSDMLSILSINMIDNAGNTRVLNKAAEDLKDKLLDVDDISKVEFYGGQEREIWIQIDRDRMEAFGISLDEVISSVRLKNTNIPGGSLDLDNRSYNLKTRGEITRSADFADIIVRRRPDEGSVAVGDIGTIGNGFGEAEYDARFNGVRSITMLISKSKDGNSIHVVDRVKKEVDSFKESLPEGISIELSNDNTFFIRDTLSTLGWNSLMGFIVLVLVLFVFIGLRNSLITALGIPITFAITFIFMEWYGESLNGNSLFALVLVLGMIVDHAIVIIENSYRHQQTGLSPAQAAIVGTNEVVKPVIAATMTTVAAFLPLMLLPGIMGKFMRIIPIISCLALIASTGEALLFLPCHFAEWGGKVKQKGTGFIGRWQGAFKGLIEKLFRRRRLVMLATVTTIVVAAIMTKFVQEDLFAEEDWTMFYVDIELPSGTPRETTDKIVRRFEERLAPFIGKGEIVSLTTTVGMMQTDDDWVEQDNVGQITVDVTELKDGRDRPMVTIMDDFKKLCNDIPGAENVGFRKVNSGPPMGKPVEFRLSGDNYNDMASIADDFKNILSEYPELYNIKDNFNPGAPEIHVVLNEERAAELGLSTAQIGMYIRNCFEGALATTYYDRDEEIDVIVKLDKKDRNSIDDVLQMKFPTPDGRLIPFSTVCSIERKTGISIIKRHEQKREITVTAAADDKKNIKTINARVEQVFNEKFKQSYPGISLKMGGEWQEFKVLLMDILRLFWIGLFLIYVILGTQFKSFIQPVIIMFTIPFAFVGCIMFLFFSGTPISAVVLFAGVALAGISVNDSIVLISFINNLRSKGISIADAVSEGASVRLRPIILTSVTTIAGLLPMAIGLGGHSATWGPMAATIIFGLFFSTIGTLIVIPCAYGILDDATSFFRLKKK
ncbi:MAG: AcrB/AcrD/AcrF family protein [Chitinivibrionales bacterium]|nr:AcrB/AcrD/AcrF family protein [Chitinivibrionales bacterium]